MQGPNVEWTCLTRGQRGLRCEWKTVGAYEVAYAAHELLVAVKALNGNSGILIIIP